MHLQVTCKTRNRQTRSMTIHYDMTASVKKEKNGASYMLDAKDLSIFGLHIQEWVFLLCDPPTNII